MEEEMPKFLYEMLNKQYGENITKQITEGYKEQRKVTFRVNTLKSNAEKIKNILDNEKIKYKEVQWNKNALIIEEAEEEIIRELEIYKNGEIYLQSLSSMLPPIILNPKEGENILDMAAAPGGKTTQIVAMTNNKAMVTACEKNKIRAERLKYNLQKQGANRVNVMLEDARRLSDFFLFDKILLDAPCSGSGTETIKEKNFTKELVEKSMKVQEELLRKALKMLKPGNEIVYSTCSILEQENENILQKVLKSVEIIPIDNIEGLPILPTKIKGTLCVCPTELYEGFFVAKLRKK